MNGVAERLNQTIVDRARTLLHQSNIGKSFWPEAVLFFVYAWNKLCHGDQTKTPFELYTGVKQSIRPFKKFCSTVYVGIPRPQQNKLDPKAKKGILVGYGYHTHTEEDKVVESCNVSFSQIDQNSSDSGAMLVPEIPNVKDDDELVDSVEIGREVLDENLPSSSLQSTHQMVPQSQEEDSSKSEDDHGDKSSISSPHEVVWI
ncbi:retrovirus-related Pol polyprotein from transposon TNT 1-94 [Trichonephila inaurata madagascariensis]|uniref:Retrovirus-related Pol polyprotein from transposon TNT 1-94 n=1 Tax=Trichonephila inaurata madagascariensis TaxID=2747483 RepID=A0A8X6YG23_9ARAC|nr:retrovirus-related Pol polyprotein from transposon TNT 1-94 [Trichonephila inaurata madagascariensis]